MSQAVDYSYAHPSPWAIAQAGYVGVLRYLGWDFGSGPRCISKPEYDALIAAGLAVDLVWETNADMVLRGAAGGAADGAHARDLCNQIGHQHPVYCAIDFDISPSQQATADQYKDAFNAAQGVEFYGKYDVIEHAGTGWQCCAWSGFGSGTGGSSQGRRVSNKARLFQGLGYVLGNTCDYNDVLGGRGSYAIGTDAPSQVLPTSPTPDPGTVAHQDSHVLSGTTVEIQHDLTVIAAFAQDTSMDPKGVDGVWGPDTEAAVRAFQGKYGLSVDGIVGDETIGKLRFLTFLVMVDQAKQSPPDQPVPPVEVIPAPETPPGEWFPPSHSPFPGGLYKHQEPDLVTDANTGGVVSLIQGQMLARDPNLGTQGFAVDGVFGQQTEDVIRQFQRESGLGDTGIVDEATWNAIYERPTS